MKKLFLYLILNALYLIFFTPSADAGTIINRPLAIGLNQGLVGHWTFDGKDMNRATGTAYDISGNRNDGTLTNGPRPASGRIGQGLEFDGVNDFVDAGNDGSLNTTGSFTISAWIYPRSFGGGSRGRIVDRDTSNAGYIFFVDNTGGANATQGLSLLRNAGGDTNFVKADNSINLNQWQYVAATYNATGNAVAIYVNGKSVSTSGSWSAPPSSASIQMYIGRSPVTATREFNGLLDDVRVYNRALSQDEIKRLYNLGGTFVVNKSQSTGTLKDGLVGHWTFDGKDMVGGQTARDISGQGNNGTLTNGPVTTIGRIGQALEFDGSRNGVVVTMGVNAKLNLSTQTNAAWIKLATSSPDTTTKTIYSYASLGGSGSIFVTIGDEVRWFSGGGCCLHDTSGVDLKAGVWYHVAVTYTDTTTIENVKIYVDGVLRKTGNETLNPINILDATPAIGGRESSDTFIESLGGLIDDVRVYNRVLSADEIKRLYNLGGTFTVNKSQSTGTLKDGLVGHWTFDGKDMNMAIGTAYDISGNSNNGTLTNGPRPASGRIGQALNFDGGDDYVNLGTGIRPALPVTISAWINPTAVINKKGIFSTDRLSSTVHSGIYLSTGIIGAQGNLEVTYGNNTTCDASGRRTKTGGSAIPLNTWSHVVAVVRGATDMSLYINGVDGGGSYTGSGSDLVYTGNSGTIGKLFDCFDGDDKALPGLIDDVRIYNRALPTDEIKRLYNMGR